MYHKFEIFGIPKILYISTFFNKDEIRLKKYESVGYKKGIAS